MAAVLLQFGFSLAANKASGKFNSGPTVACWSLVFGCSTCSVPKKRDDDRRDDHGNKIKTIKTSHELSCFWPNEGHCSALTRTRSLLLLSCPFASVEGPLAWAVCCVLSGRERERD